MRDLSLRLLAVLATLVIAGGAAPAARGAGAPVITSLEPSDVVANDISFICGQNLSSATGVTVDGVSVSFALEDDGCLSFIAPEHAAGVAQVRVVYAGGVSADAGSADDLHYFGQCAQPIVTSVSPSSGSDLGGNVVVIRGSNLAGTLGVVFGFSVLGTDLQLVSDTELRVTAPPAPAPGRVDLVIIDGCGSSSNTPADDYTYTHATAVVPAVTSVSPNKSALAGGDTIDLFGTGFDSTAVVKFGTVEGDVVSVVSSTQLRVVVPASPIAKKVDITVTNAAGTSANTAADDFTYTAPLPVITKVSPPSGRANVGGTTLITGTNLAGVKSVRFGTKSARKVYVFPGFVIAIAPPQARGAYNVTLVTAAGTSLPNSAARYFYF